jgi:hypothetical protein
MRGGISRLLHRREYLGLRECGSGPICVPHHSLQTPEWTVGAPAEPARRWTARCPRQDIPGVWCQKGSGRGPPGARECIFVPDGTNKVAGTRYTVPCFPWRYCRCLPAGPAYTTGRLFLSPRTRTQHSSNTPCMSCNLLWLASWGCGACNTLTCARSSEGGRVTPWRNSAELLSIRGREVDRGG